MRISLQVVGYLPPKKDGATSMWNKPSEFKRLVALRQAAAKARGNRQPLCHEISMKVELFLPRPEDKATGDLDNFITGICDGLMAAHPRSKKHSGWTAPALSVCETITPVDWA